MTIDQSVLKQLAQQLLDDANDAVINIESVSTGFWGKASRSYEAFAAYVREHVDLDGITPAEMPPIQTNTGSRIEVLTEASRGLMRLKSCVNNILSKVSIMQVYSLSTEDWRRCVTEIYGTVGLPAVTSEWLKLLQLRKYFTAPSPPPMPGPSSLTLADIDKKLDNIIALLSHRV